MDYRDKILSLMRLRPVLPTAVANHLGVSTIIAAAMLSELSSKKLVRISHLKIGSSPLYYVPEHEEKLVDYAKNLGTKDYQAYEQLKEQRVIRESDAAPLMRVCLKRIKDFAKPLEVTYDGKTEIFYKWFLLSDDQATEIITTILQTGKKEPEVKLEKEVTTIEIPSKDSVPPEKTVKESERQLSSSVSDKEIKGKKTARDSAQAEDKKSKEVTRTKQSKDTVDGVAGKSVTREKNDVQAESQQSLVRVDESSDPFLKKIAAYCKIHDICLRSAEVKRKNAEIHLELDVPSPVGRLTFFTLAKNKKKVSDADISTAFVNGQVHKLPVIMLSPGELTKKARELLKNLKGVTFTSL
ncbi:hypothetical protein GF342_01570 [Candidatus Woesearchaeota archaeon]|nr:hypothetical protein [Candidatus Woesearchaeota archaeon]